MGNCIFCKIINRDIPAVIVAENEHVIAIKDIAPKAPIHYLIIPKQHVADITSLGDGDVILVGQAALMARDLALQLPGAQSFRLVANNGAEVGQSVFHLHFHFLSGKQWRDL